MKAMIFAAGLGTRLRPLTDHTPKALVSVAGKPMLERVILRLKEAGFNDITVNIHHFGEQIIEFLRANNDFGITIHLSDERDMLLDTGGGIKKARPFSGRQRTVPGAQCRHPFPTSILQSFTGIIGKQCRGHTARQSTTDITLPAAGRCQPPARLDKQVHRRGETGRLRLPGNEVPGTRLRRNPCHLPLPSSA